MSQTVLFSGRFDRPHPGHIRTIQLLGQKFDKVLVVILDYPEQKYPVEYRAQIIKDILSRSIGCYEVIISPFHFGKISLGRLLEFDFDIYAAGNIEVIKHIETLARSIDGMAARKITTMWVDRPYGYDSSTERLGTIVRGMA